MLLDKTNDKALDYFIEKTTPRVIENKEDIHHSKIALAAYYKAEKRDFSPSHELDDWLEAEHDIMGCQK